jgi:hypothetical protein
MDRPFLYGDSYIANQNMPYEMIEVLPSGSCRSGGVLGKGKRVWMRHESQATGYRHDVSVYVEDIGIIVLNPQCLSRLD